jgi:DNA-binding NarL/FixJ family response regulator
MGRKLRVVIVDDHPIFVEGAKAVLEEGGMEVIGSAKDLEGARSLLVQGQVDVALIDLGLGGEDGLALVAELAERPGATKALVVSMRPERHFAAKALSAGAKGYVMKEAAAVELAAAVGRVAEGGIWLSERQKDLCLQSAFSAPKPPKAGAEPELPPRQAEILRLLGKGLGAVKIAEALDIKPKTVEAHMLRLRKRLCLASNAELKCYAVESAFAASPLTGL